MASRNHCDASLMKQISIPWMQRPTERGLTSRFVRLLSTPITPKEKLENTSSRTGTNKQISTVFFPASFYLRKLTPSDCCSQQLRDDKFLVCSLELCLSPSLQTQQIIKFLTTPKSPPFLMPVLLPPALALQAAVKSSSPLQQIALALPWTTLCSHVRPPPAAISWPGSLDARHLSFHFRQLSG